MQNFMKTILSAVQTWTKGKIKDSTADWNQNDSSAVDYVKNRTHWEEEVATVFVDNTELTFTPDDGGACWIDTPFSLTLVEGQAYTVVWDDVEYVLEAYDDDGIILGNSMIWWNNDYTEEYANPPFVINASWVGIYNPSVEETHTVSISTTQTVVHTLDPKYLDLPDNIATTDNVDSKMDKDNPVGTGSFSMNRMAGTTIGSYSHAEGENTTASGDYSHAEGFRTTASGDYSHAEGYYNIASGESSHVEGGGENYGVGKGNTASGRYSHAEGGYTVASGDYSHAEGALTTASGESSHVEGARTIASGDDSHAEGMYSAASGRASHAEGHSTTAASDNQHVQGKYNIKDSIDTYAHIVGNGTSDTARSNAHTLDWDGNAWYQGDVYVGSTSGTNKDDGSKKLATEEYVTNTIYKNLETQDILDQSIMDKYWWYMPLNAPRIEVYYQGSLVKTFNRTSMSTSNGANMWKYGNDEEADATAFFDTYSGSDCVRWYYDESSNNVTAEYQAREAKLKEGKGKYLTYMFGYLAYLDEEGNWVRPNDWFPISCAEEGNFAKAIDFALKYSLAISELVTEEYVNTSIANLVDSAPETLNTLNELATAIQENGSVIDTLNATIANKVTVPQDAVAGDLLTYDGTNWVRISKADLISDILLAIEESNK